MDGSTPDCNASCPLYPSYAGTGQYFYDQPNQFVGSNVTWVAQASLLLTGQASAALTFMWGYALSNGTTIYIAPVPVAPWPSQQKLIQEAY
jgi:hypothetical protein